MLQLDQPTTLQGREEIEGESGLEQIISPPWVDELVDQALSRSVARTTTTTTTTTVNPEQTPRITPIPENADEANTEQWSHHAANNADTSPLISLQPKIIRRRRATLHPLQEWEGYVVAIDGDEFVARLIDLSAGLSHESEEATIPLDEISDRDVANLEIGSIFRWVIGYERSPEGTRKRVSQIVFRDLPRMTDSDLHAGREWARKMVPALNP